MLIHGHDAAVAAWVGRHVSPVIPDFGPCVAIGVAQGDAMLAGAVYNNWRHPNIEITFAMDSPKWASRRNIACILRYPFVQLRCLRITAFTAAGNDRARAFLTNPLIGFVQEGYHPHGFSHDDAVSYGLLRENCRWVKPEEYEVCPKAANTH